MTTLMTTVQQIVYTRDPGRWHALAEALGLVPPFPPEPGWSEFDGGGILAVHRDAEGHPNGTVDLHLLVDDLDGAQRALAGHDVTRAAMDGVGDVLTVRAASGVTISVSAGARTTAGDVLVQPIWFQDDIAEAQAILEAVGLRADIVADRGGWVEMRADGGGSVGVHAGPEPTIGLGLPVATSMRWLLVWRMPDSRHPWSMRRTRGPSASPSPPPGSTACRKTCTATTARADVQRSLRLCYGEAVRRRRSHRRRGIPP